MTRCWRRNWSRRMENNDKMLEMELDKTVLRNSTNEDHRTLEPEDGEQ